MVTTSLPLPPATADARLAADAQLAARAANFDAAAIAAYAKEENGSYYENCTYDDDVVPYPVDAIDAAIDAALAACPPGAAADALFAAAAAAANSEESFYANMSWECRFKDPAFGVAGIAKLDIELAISGARDSAIAAYRTTPAYALQAALDAAIAAAESASAAIARALDDGAIAPDAALDARAAQSAMDNAADKAQYLALTLPGPPPATL